MIRRLFYLLLLFSFMLSHADWSQWVRVPILVHHFVEHQATHPTPLTWVDFLELHYGQSIEHPDDAHGDHSKLPFLTYHAPTLFVPLVSSTFRVVPTLVVLDTFKNTFYDFLPSLLQQDLSTIWHPPMKLTA